MHSLFCFIFLFSFPLLGLSKETIEQSSLRDTSEFQTRCMILLNNLEISYQGKTRQKNDYNVYAFQYGRDWTFLIRNSVGVFAFIQGRKDEEPREASDLFTEGMCEIVASGKLKLKSKTKQLNDMTLTSYYEFSKEAKIVYDGFWYLETGQKKQGKFADTMLTVVKPLVNLFQGQNQALIAQIQAYKDLASQYEAQMQDMKTQMEEQKKLIEEQKEAMKEQPGAQLKEKAEALEENGSNR